jgi:predicted metal-binding protein
MIMEVLRGSACPKCESGYFIVVNTVVKEKAGVRVQYFACNSCQFRPDQNKVVKPLEGERLRERRLADRNGK